MLIVFEANGAETFRGFRASYTCLNESEIISSESPNSIDIETTTHKAVLSGAVIAITGIVGGVFFAGVILLVAVLIVRRHKKSPTPEPIPLQLVDY